MQAILRPTFQLQRDCLVSQKVDQKTLFHAIMANCRYFAVPPAKIAALPDKANSLAKATIHTQLRAQGLAWWSKTQAVHQLLCQLGTLICLTRNQLGKSSFGGCTLMQSRAVG